MAELMQLIEERRSSRGLFDSRRPVPAESLQFVLAAARWAPTAHNMQNFEFVVVDDQALLQAIAKIKRPVSKVFIRENYRHLAFSEDELHRKKVGILASRFPAAWLTPQAKLGKVAGEAAPLGEMVSSCPRLLVVLYDPSDRAPASPGDLLGKISLGCVLQNMWLAAQAQGLSFHVLSALGTPSVARSVKRLLGIPARLQIPFGIRLGYSNVPVAGPRVRRDVTDFVHVNQYRKRG